MQVAVHDLCLGIPGGQRFGFLGPNGAGKTTTLSILSGDQQATSGDALVAGQSLVHSSGASPRGALLGYCPQQVDPPFLNSCHAEIIPAISRPNIPAALLILEATAVPAALCHGTLKELPATGMSVRTHLLNLL